MVRKKKDVIKPVVAKPLNDTEKRNLVTSFVTNNINESVSDNITNNSSENITNADTDNVAENVNINDINIVNNKDTKNVIDNNTISVTDNVINSDTDKLTVNDTNKVNKNSTKNVTKKVTIVKTISIGKKDIIAKFTSDKRVRPNYNLSQDTVEKIEKISEILGYKKAEFVDIYLNGTLEKVLKDLEKKL
ncbi:hypothetical protein [Clostridium beijerinckii]|uniref:hypothetical protein n=2 Tax=Clostridium beijerinckii TaxID=1520 RepID=UPI0009CD34F1|nr:hypothetical protein [Clostridium beijerinckii]NRZ29523.1 hypothetical protein [Clostridium beijerinckii]NYC00025.1 hypothetical protein [Clostridium beijerinckii]OOM22713.1 hypothetical protein CLBEI_31130 [Clostridium beijerinckii]SQB12005.1 Uncharacterised protein [Clostridium beijerinckii]